MSDTFKREDTWTISCHTNQLIAQLGYLNCELLNTKKLSNLTETIKLINQYEEKLQEYIK
jgi:hypothetical protein